MSQQPNIELLPYEDKSILAIQALKEDASLSERRVAVIYNVRRSTIQDQHAGTTSRRNSQDIPCRGSMMPDSTVEMQINTSFLDPDEMA
jgi:hypothetical protein